MEVLSKEKRRELDSNLLVKDIPLTKIKDNPYQPRKGYPKRELKLLAKSISERGLLHPIAVVKMRGGYVIVGGHRRFRAFKLLHRRTIPAIVRRNTTKKDLALDLAIENALRKDFSPAEKGQAIFTVLSTIKNVNNDILRAYSLCTQVKLMNKRGIEKVTNTKGNAVGFTNSDIFKCQRLLNLLGMAENTATKYLRLLGLPKYIQDKIVAIHSNESLSKRMITEGYITVTMAYEISRIKNEQSRLQLYENTIQEKWNSITLRHVVDELLESGQEEQINKLGTSKRRGDEDWGISTLTRRCFSLSSSLWNFRKRLSIIPLTMEKIIWRASLKKLKKAALNLVDHIMDLLNEEKGLWDRIELDDENIEVVVGRGKSEREFRFTFPSKKGVELELKPGDRLIFNVQTIKRKSK